MTYVPRPGSIAARAIAAIEKRGPLTRAELGTALGVGPSNVDGNLGPAIAHGLITRERCADGRARFAVGAPAAKSAAPPPPTPDAPAQFLAALYHDGELDIYHTLEVTAPGGRVGVRLAVDQVAQLRRLLAGGGA